MPTTDAPTSSRHRLAALLASAAAELAQPPAPEPPPPASPWTLLGTPVRAGRLHVGRLRRFLPNNGDVTVAAAFAGVCWLGAAADQPPLGRLVHRTRATVDARGRLLLDRQVRLWLAVPDERHFAVVFAPAERGLFVVPTHDADRRWTGAAAA